MKETKINGFVILSKERQAAQRRGVMAPNWQNVKSSGFTDTFLAF